jgi:hypothetical protein
MKLENDKEVLLIGGNSHLVIYIWEEGKLVEFYNQSFTNVIEIKVCDNWFVIKYKKKKAHIFRLLTDDQEIEMGGDWPLKIQPFKNEYQTIDLARFRKNQLIIIDVSFKSNGFDLQMELFNTRTKSTDLVEDLNVDGRTPVCALIYTPKFRKLAVFDHEQFMKTYEFDKEVKDNKQTGIRKLASTKTEFKDTVTRVLINPLKNYFIIGTKAGELIFMKADSLKIDPKLDTEFHIIDIMLCDIDRLTQVYVLMPSTKDFVKILLEPTIGNLLYDRYNVLNPIYDDGNKTIFLMERGN